MRMRSVVGLAVAISGLVVALPARAATQHVVTFDGLVEIVADSTTRTVELCFFASGGTCLNGEPTTGEAIGAAVDQGPGLVDGLQASVTYQQSCTAGLLTPDAPQATEVSVRVHREGAGWSPEADATWTQTGPVAVIEGGATGVVLVTPVESGSCAQPMLVRLTGTVTLPG